MLQRRPTAKFLIASLILTSVLVQAYPSPSHAATARQWQSGTIEHVHAGITLAILSCAVTRSIVTSGTSEDTVSCTVSDLADDGSGIFIIVRMDETVVGRCHNANGERAEKTCSWTTPADLSPHTLRVVSYVSTWNPALGRHHVMTQPTYWSGAVVLE